LEINTHKRDKKERKRDKERHIERERERGSGRTGGREGEREPHNVGRMGKKIRNEILLTLETGAAPELLQSCNSCERDETEAHLPLSI